MEVGAILWLLTVSSGIGAEKFVVIQDKSSIVATEGETVVIPCRHNFTNKVWSYQWFKGAQNGIEVTNETAEYRGRFFRPPGGDPTTNSTDVSLQLKDVRPSDSGMYFCKLEAIKWKMYGAGTNLAVRGIGAEKFVVIQDKSSIVATEGETVVIPCRHNVTNKIWSHHWVKGAQNGTEVTNETAEYRGRFLRPQGDDPSTNSSDVSLQLKHVRLSDSAMYFCKLESKEWEIYGAGTNLTVRGKSKSFTVTQGQSSIFVREGETD
ncbi:tyrosine-protein phosphatase non-receptor type substrate 1-like, partial [Mobula birostris]|uniref:tyrosine-protein phosphatase non-receptor type substrate 1-like n=1 Tax=Mobula birostris TaxID=1983395 RepID=UPI003B27CE21